MFCFVFFTLLCSVSRSPFGQRNKIFEGSRDISYSNEGVRWVHTFFLGKRETEAIFRDRRMGVVQYVFGDLVPYLCAVCTRDGHHRKHHDSTRTMQARRRGRSSLTALNCLRAKFMHLPLPVAASLTHKSCRNTYFGRRRPVCRTLAEYFVSVVCEFFVL